MGQARNLQVLNETRVNVPLEVVQFWQDVADDRGVSGRLRLLPFTPERPFGETLGGRESVLYVTTDPGITPIIFIRANGIHEIRHMEQNEKPWLIDEEGRETLIRLLLRADGLERPDVDFFTRHHDWLPEEVDAYVFEREVAGFNGRPWAKLVRSALGTGSSLPTDPEQFRLPVTRPFQVSR